MQCRHSLTRAGKGRHRPRARSPPINTTTSFPVPWVRASSVAVFAAQLLGYVALSSIVEFAYYHRRRGDETSWKCQPRAIRPGDGDGDGDAHRRGSSRKKYAWGLPLLDYFASSSSSSSSSSRGRHPKHATFASLNLLVSALFAGATAEATARGHSSLTSWTAPPLTSLVALVKIILWQSVLEYYWHRAMHAPRLYKRLHKYHHHYKSPRPFDDLFIHPLEAAGYCAILYSSAFVCGEVPIASFLAYMAIMGVCGIIDHCGVRFRVGFGFGFGERNGCGDGDGEKKSISKTITETTGADIGVEVYASRFHDLHHERFDVNYAFPFAFMDALHGTFAES